MYRKWLNVRPTFFPGPLIVLATLTFSVRIPALIAVAVLLPHLLYPRGLRAAAADPRCLLDAYLQLLQESSDDIGFIDGLWRFRHLIPGPVTETVPLVGSRDGTGRGP